MGDTHKTDFRIAELTPDIRSSLYITKNHLEAHLKYLEETTEEPESKNAQTKLVIEKSIKEIGRLISERLSLYLFQSGPLLSHLLNWAYIRNR